MKPALKPLIKVEPLLFLAFLVPLSAHVSLNIPENDANLRVSFAVPEGIQDAPYFPTIPENFNGTYLNTTNTYSDMISPMSAFDEVDDIEGNHPMYVLVAGDEEERQNWRWLGGHPFDWKSWATLQIERGDEALVANFGIDIRILGFIEWDSDDSKTTMTGLWHDLESKTSQYIGQVWTGNGWHNYVDVIIGITAQETPGCPPGVAELGGRIALVKWQVYWMDDNIVQHEVSHLFYADDHNVPHHEIYGKCCVMEGDKHSISYLWEDGLWWVFNDIPCCYLTYSWCDEPPLQFYPRRCFSTTDQHKSKYNGDLPILLDWWDVYEYR
ncbi:MAG: hypothetical protein ACPLW8_06045, partial [Candidatus Bathyarchaeales archaeon]